jgi:hypothetical protein
MRFLGGLVLLEFLGVMILASVMPGARLVADGTAGDGAVENNGIVLDATTTVMNVPGGITLNGSQANILIFNISPTVSSPVRLFDPIGSLAAISNVSDGHAAYYEGVNVAAAEGLWQVKDNLDLPVSGFKIAVWAGGPIAADSSLVTVFTDSANFKANLVHLYGDQEIGGPVPQGHLDANYAPPGSTSCGGQNYGQVGLGGNPVLVVEAYMLGTDYNLGLTQRTVRAGYVLGAVFNTTPSGAAVTVSNPLTSAVLNIETVVIPNANYKTNGLMQMIPGLICSVQGSFYTTN